MHNVIPIQRIDAEKRRTITKIYEPDYKRRADSYWDFTGIQASSGVNGIHPYPAMLHYLVVRELLHRYSKPLDVVLDPFIGSGVVATECLKARRKCIGYDINPLAIKIAKARITITTKDKLLYRLKKILLSFDRCNAEGVAFPNIEYWFNPHIIVQLSRLKKALRFQNTDNDLSPFFETAFSETVRRASNTRYNEFKLFRKTNYSNPVDVEATFEQVCHKNIDLLSEYSGFRVSRGCNPRIQEQNSQQQIPLSSNSVDLVITSPPYGDSRTTVAYGQFSRLALQWLGLEERVDRTSLGARAKGLANGLPSALLYSVLKTVKEKDLKRAREVYSFYFDLWESYNHIANTIKPDGIACIIVGNRRVKGEELPTDAISAEFFVTLGFDHIETIVRKITNKRMPSVNSPTNIRGATDSTMRNEYIVILKKKAAE